jgi:hypothetical protein
MGFLTKLRLLAKNFAARAIVTGGKNERARKKGVVILWHIFGNRSRFGGPRASLIPARVKDANRNWMAVLSA